MEIKIFIWKVFLNLKPFEIDLCVKYSSIANYYIQL